ncbi:MAG: leucyl aminopeptidase [Ignavibacteriaceae bacterium]|nr:leucyl aminopeptidase [Ignavibacteria bacterium]NNJ53469.1 leucyl aminopeptidase [Ignavibacteriaceae bacterium]NNL21194.1 leucyl aminopeptidase [Ignavibacteriaceae bacterium]
MYNLKINSGGKKAEFKPLSAAITYVVDDKNLKSNLSKIEDQFEIKLSALQIKNMISKEGSEITFSNSIGSPDSIIISKVKLDKKFSSDYFRNHLAGAIKKLEKVESLYLFIPEFKNFSKYFMKEEYYYRTFIEGLYLGNYSFDKFKKDKKEPRVLNVLLFAQKEKFLKSALEKTAALADGIYFTKNLQNEPASTLRPFELANSVKSVLTKAGIKVTVFDEKEAKKRKMGGLLAVGMGSTNKPRFIIAHYKPKAAKKKMKKIALVGKGVTFDTGGYCVKPAQGMTEMKADMSGAALVAGTLLAAAKANLSVEILGIIPAAENMISGDAMRPGDVVKTASGKTIEVGHTDAEGRMILADALDYASKEKPDEIIDFATLTGACVVALGQNAAGLFTKYDKLAEKLYDTGMKTFDRVWRLPMWDEYAKANESKIADVNNDGGRYAGATTAAKFLENFVDEKIPWAHIDIAGPAIAHDLNNYTKTFMTGFGVRLMFEYLAGK